MPRLISIWLMVIGCCLNAQPGGEVDGAQGIIPYGDELQWDYLLQNGEQEAKASLPIRIGLAVELWEHILSFLIDVEDLSRARLTCKAWYFIGWRLMDNSVHAMQERIFALTEGVFAHTPRSFGPYPQFTALCPQLFPKIPGLRWNQLINSLVAWRDRMPGFYVLHAAAGNGDLPMIDWLLRMRADLEAPNEEGNGPGVVAIQQGQLEALRLLLDLGLPIESLSRGLTLLMFAAYYNQGAILEELIRRGADVHAATEDRQETALQFAVRGRNQEAARILIDHGADPETATGGDIPGITAIDRARNYGDEPLLQLLEEARERRRKRSIEGAPLDIQALAGFGINNLGSGDGLL